MSDILQPRALFWLVALPGLSPFAVMRRKGDSVVFWDRRVILIRLLEAAGVGVYLLAAHVCRWNFSLRAGPRAGMAGLALTVAGVILASWSKIRLGRHFSTTLGVKKNHQLIDSGPYRWMRHPMYTGLLGVLLGGALAYDSGAVLILLFLPFSVFFYWQSMVEEKLLAGHLGRAYREYQAGTGRLLPRIRWR
jgi:protein-S-isoprenylcysteine O-methyltransferase